MGKKKKSKLQQVTDTWSTVKTTKAAKSSVSLDHIKDNNVVCKVPQTTSVATDLTSGGQVTSASANTLGGFITQVSSIFQPTPVASSQQKTPTIPSFVQSSSTFLSSMLQPAPVSNTNQSTPVSCTQQTTPVSNTKQTTPVSNTHQPTYVSNTHQTTPVSNTHQPTPVSNTHQPTPVYNTQQTTPVSNTQQTTPTIPPVVQSSLTFQPTIPPKRRKSVQTKTLTKGLMDISLLTSNATQLRSILLDPEHVFYHVILPLLVISICLQVFSTFLMLLSDYFKSAEEEKDSKPGLRRALSFTAVVAVSLLTVANVLISAFINPGDSRQKTSLDRI